MSSVHTNSSRRIDPRHPEVTILIFKFSIFCPPPPRAWAGPRPRVWAGPRPNPPKVRTPRCGSGVAQRRVRIFSDLGVDIVHVRGPDPGRSHESSDPALRLGGGAAQGPEFSDLGVDIVHVRIPQFLAPFLRLRFTPAFNDHKCFKLRTTRTVVKHMCFNYLS